MAGVELRITVDDADLQAKLRDLLAKIRNLRPFFKEVGEELLTSTRDRFGRSEAPDGSKWAPNSPVTLARKKGTKPLIDSGALQGTLRYQASAAELFPTPVGMNRRLLPPPRATGSVPHACGDEPP